MTTETEVQNLSMVWRGINLKVTYKPNHGSFGNYRLAHLAIQSENKKPLPITETGYRSHFTEAADIEAYETPIDFVEAWLEHEAQSKEWKAYEADLRQFKLF
ncbi:MAG: hypothetical protein AAF806_11680 [Bacteroidota bacterium]